MPTKTDKVIEFKSDTSNYYVEESGNKSNTVRVIEPSDDRKEVLDRMLKTKIYGKIKITHKQVLSECFIRDISNVTYFNGCFIISWSAIKKLEQEKDEYRIIRGIILNMIIHHNSANKNPLVNGVSVKQWNLTMKQVIKRISNVKTKQKQNEG